MQGAKRGENVVVAARPSRKRFGLRQGKASAGRTFEGGGGPQGSNKGSTKRRTLSPPCDGSFAGQTHLDPTAIPPRTNIHPTPKDHRGGNESQPQGCRSREIFAPRKLMLPVKEHQHPWMRMLVNV